MKDSVVSDNADDFSPVLANLETPSPSLIASTNAPLAETAARVPSYQAYPWPLANRVLDFVDQLTNGRAGLVQRVGSYLLFGGLAALVNLGVFYIMYYHVLAGLVARNDALGNTLSYIVAAELSILANFIPNDRFTFNKLPGAQRPWLQRCARFHMTCIVGSLLTYLIELVLSTFVLHKEAVIAEAIATLLVLIYNFTFHHVFTYRHVKHA
jgi:putative flippase GtrA